MGDGYKEFAVGEVLGSADVNGYLMKQSVMAFASGGAILAGVTSPEEGMIAYASDLDVFWYYTGSGWKELTLAGGWYDYTPAWTSSGAAPSLGNGTATGRYHRAGRMVTFFAEIVLGSTSSVGSGTYSISLPVAARTTTPAQHVQTRVSDASALQEWGGQSGALGELSARVQVQAANDNLDNASPTVPFTFATGDALRAFGTYEMAEGA